MLLHHEFVKIAKKYSNKMAIIDRTTDKRIYFARALIGSLILAKKFKKYKEGYMGIMIPTSAGSFLSILGALMAGKVPVMINYSTGAADNSKYAQEKCGFKTIITSRALLEKIRCPMIDGMVCIEDIMEEIGVGDKIAAALKSKMTASAICKGFPHAHPDDDVVILFTSGSEKEPKAVELTHTNIGSNVQDAIEVFELTSDDIIMSMLPLFHVFGQMVDFWLPMILGSTAVTYANPLDYKTIPKIIKEEKPTMMAGTPIFFAGYVREASQGDFESLRIIIAGADKTPDWLREAYMEKHGKVLLEGYGTTETSPVVSANTYKNNVPGSIGKVFPSVQVKITDINTGETKKPGEEGKILVKGPNVMKGYFDDIEETSLRVENGWYDTGDMGVLDKDGFLWHRGRLKRFVKIGGEMVSLVKTESILEETLPEGVTCCIVEIPDSLKGARLVAAVTKKVKEKEIIQKMSKTLPPIAIPKKFIVFDELPKMGSGKVDFRTITEMVRKKSV